MFPRAAFRIALAPVSRRLFSSAPAPAPPLLAKIRADLKDAMRSKDTNKLNVLRGLLAEIMNASKTPTPPTTDLHILALINKTKLKSTESIAEFRSAGREDLAEREAGQIVVLESYASQIKTVGEAEILEAVNRAIGAGAKNIGEVIKVVMGEFEGKPVVKGEVAVIAKKALAK